MATTSLSPASPTTTFLPPFPDSEAFRAIREAYNSEVESDGEEALMTAQREQTVNHANAGGQEEQFRCLRPRVDDIAEQIIPDVHPLIAEAAQQHNMYFISSTELMLRRPSSLYSEKDRLQRQQEAR
ncbi:hypothetical protein HK104_009218, partial [Borealophlyctis nickersoniae]